MFWGHSAAPVRPCRGRAGAGAASPPASSTSTAATSSAAARPPSRPRRARPHCVARARQGRALAQRAPGRRRQPGAARAARRPQGHARREVGVHAVGARGPLRRDLTGGTLDPPPGQPRSGCARSGCTRAASAGPDHPPRPSAWPAPAAITPQPPAGSAGGPGRPRREGAQVETYFCLDQLSLAVTLDMHACFPVARAGDCMAEQR